LKEAAHDFGGHRVKALEAVDAAIEQLEKALRFAGDPRPEKGTGKIDEKRFGRYPHMHKALQELRQTRTELKEAAHDYGGHREKALRATDRAIEQIELALRFAKS
jgi:hypothetical protein